MDKLKSHLKPAALMKIEMQELNSAGEKVGALSYRPIQFYSCKFPSTYTITMPDDQTKVLTKDPSLDFYFSTNKCGTPKYTVPSDPKWSISTTDKLVIVNSKIVLLETKFTMEALRLTTDTKT